MPAKKWTRETIVAWLDKKKKEQDAQQELRRQSHNLSELEFLMERAKCRN